MTTTWRLLLTSLAAIGTVFARSNVSVTPPATPQEQTAIALQNISLFTSLSASLTSSSTATTSTPPLKPGLLPHLKYHPFKVALQTETAATATIASTTAKTTPKKTVTAATNITTSPSAMTAQSFLAATTVSYRELRDGPYEIVFTTNEGGGNVVTWGLASTSTAQFGISYVCNPTPTSPLITDSDQNPTFAVRTTGDCDVTLQPLLGPDMRAESKDFSFTTPAGQFVVTGPASMDTVLQQNENDGGFVFNNEDNQTTSLSGITINISYTALNTAQGPLVLRFVNPATGASFDDYHLENLPTDPTTAYTHSQTDISIPLGFVINPSTQKLLPIELLGAEPMSILGVNPTVTITLDSVATNPTVSKLAIGSAQISWSCAVPIGGYDPNATSGAFAAGNACQ